MHYGVMLKMTIETAKETLRFHSGRHSMIDDPRWIGGFLGSLRPYRGKLDHDNFHDLMSCLKALANELNSKDYIDRQIVTDLSSILHLGRAWVLSPNGMLQSNSLIEDSDIREFEAWLDILGYSFTMALEIGDGEETFSLYEDYKSGNYFA